MCGSLFCIKDQEEEAFIKKNKRNNVKSIIVGKLHNKVVVESSTCIKVAIVVMVERLMFNREERRMRRLIRKK